MWPKLSWMIHTQPTYDPVAQWNRVFIENTVIIISKMCGHITTHYNTCIQDMLRTVLAFQVTTLCMDQSTMLHSAHQ